MTKKTTSWMDEDGLPPIPVETARVRLKPGTTAALHDVARANRHTLYQEVQIALDAHIRLKQAEAAN